MKTLTLFTLVLSLNSFAQIAEIKKAIPNFHQVDKDGFVFRGKEPKAIGTIERLSQYGIKEVIIFKNQTKTEVDTELAEIETANMTSHHLPFLWKDIDSVVGCEQVIEAVNKIDDAVAAKNKIFFHCTAGEDRTGLLAGTYRMLSEGISTKEAFTKEMCARNYSDGNKNKPAMVTAAIQKGLTPLFLAMAEKIQSGEWKLGKLSKKLCKDLKFEPTKLTCKTLKEYSF